MRDLIGLLHGDGLLTRAECTALRKAAQDLNESPAKILRSLNVAAPQDIQRCFRVYFNFPLVTDALIESLTPDYAALVPVDLALHFGAFGFGQEGNRLFVAVEDPTDRRVIESLRFFLNCEICPAAANVYQLSAALERLYGVPESHSGLLTVLDKARGAGAWSQHERALFEQIFEERRLREEEDARAAETGQVGCSQDLWSDDAQEDLSPQPEAPQQRMAPGERRTAGFAGSAGSSEPAPGAVPHGHGPAHFQESEEGPAASELARPEVPRMELTRIAQRAVIKLALVPDQSVALGLVNEMFEKTLVSFVLQGNGRVAAALDGVVLSARELQAAPWSALRPVLRLLEKTTQSKAS